MEEEKIVALYWKRDEGAIRETEEKYGKSQIVQVFATLQVASAQVCSVC